MIERTDFLLLRKFVFFRSLVANKGKRESELKSDKAQGTMGRGKEKEEEAKHLLARFLLPAFLCEQIYIERSTSGNEPKLQRSAYFFITYEVEFNNCSVILLPARCILSLLL